MSHNPSAKILVVVYKTSTEQSTTLQSLSKLPGAKNVDIVIRDNSPEQLIFEDSVKNILFSFSSVRINWDGENTPLSTIYNEFMSEPSEKDWFILLDDDTNLPENFLLEIANAVHVGSDADLVLPVVMCGKRIVSPGDYQFIKGRHWTTPKRGIVPSASVVAITSGMAIRSDYIRQYPRPFNENLPFYGIDTRFCLDYRSRRHAIYVTNSTLNHDSALWKEQNSDEKRNRFKALKKATYQIHRRQPMAISCLIALNFFSSLRRAIKFRDIRYIL